MDIGPWRRGARYQHTCAAPTQPVCTTSVLQSQPRKVAFLPFRSVSEVLRKHMLLHGIVDPAVNKFHGRDMQGFGHTQASFSRGSFSALLLAVFVQAIHQNVFILPTSFLSKQRRPHQQQQPELGPRLPPRIPVNSRLISTS